LFKNKTRQIRRHFKAHPEDNRNTRNMVFTDTNELQSVMHLLQSVHSGKNVRNCVTEFIDMPEAKISARFQ